MKKKQRTAPVAREEQQFLANYDASQFPHPSVTVDVALVTAAEGWLRALLIERHEHPGKGKWSLPGGFVQMTESLDDAAARVMAGKAGIPGIFLEQLYTFGQPDRDPAHARDYGSLLRPGRFDEGHAGPQRRRSRPLGLPTGALERRAWRDSSSVRRRGKRIAAGVRSRPDPGPGGQAAPRQTRLRADRL